MLQVNNITCTFELGCGLSFPHLKGVMWDVEFKRNMMILRIRKPAATALVFEKGSVSMSGTKSIKQARIASRRFARKIQKAGYAVSVKNFSVHNIALSTKVPFKLDITKLPATLQNRVSVETELFNGGIVYGKTIENHSKRYIFFSTGTIIATGYKQIAEANSHYDCIVDIANAIRQDQ